MRIILSILCICATNLWGYSPTELIEHVQKSIDLANNHQSKLPLSVLQIDGMSSNKNRHFLNNICALEDINYLEIGVWKGSTFFSALYNNYNIQTATAVENWSLDSYTATHFFSNKDKFKRNLPTQLVIFEQDCFSIPLSNFKQPIQIYFYDGRHETEDQRKAFTYFNPILDDLFIAIVDDWNHPPVPEGTRIAFEELGYVIHQEWILPAHYNGDLDLWWNGLYVAVVGKH